MLKTTFQNKMEATDTIRMRLRNRSAEYMTSFETALALNVSIAELADFSRKNELSSFVSGNGETMYHRRQVEAISGDKPKC